MLLFLWVASAAAAATVRMGYLAYWFSSRRPLGIAVVLEIAFLAVTVALWMSVFAAWRRLGASR